MFKAKSKFYENVSFEQIILGKHKMTGHIYKPQTSHVVVPF